MITRLQRRQNVRKKWCVIGAVLTIFVATVFAVWRLGAEEVLPVSAKKLGQAGLAEHLFPRGRDILSSVIPGLANNAERQAPVKVQPELSFQSALRGSIMFLTGIDLKDIRSLLRVEIPFIALFTNNSPAVSAMSLPNFPKFDWRKSTPAGKPLVAVYHTHTAESFVPSAGVAHRPGGQTGEIVEVGESLVKRLAHNGVPAVQSTSIHDYPSFMKAYGPSGETARKLLADNPSIQMIFDIHRDAEKRENTTAMINGVAVARIAIVVGMGQQDLIQPHWQQNHAFAKLIDAKLNQRYPGLSRGIQLVEWRYNQHIHPRALLMEVGCQENSKEEAIRSMELLADVLAEILAES